MPRLLACVLCEKVITDRLEDLSSLITVLESVTVNVPDTLNKIPDTLLIPMRWALFMIWMREKADTAEHYEVMVHVVSPSGRETHLAFIEPLDFLPNKSGQRVVGRSRAFPAAEQGYYTIRAAVREKGAVNWDERGTWPFFVTHKTVEATTPLTALAPTSQVAYRSSQPARRKQTKKR